LPGRLLHAEPPGRHSRSGPVGGPLGLQQFDLKDLVRTGPNIVTVEVKGERGLMCQSVGAQQINEAMGSIASNVRETSAALEELNKRPTTSAPRSRSWTRRSPRSRCEGAMLALTFQVGREALAPGARRVREALPRVRP